MAMKSEILWLYNYFSSKTEFGDSVLKHFLPIELLTFTESFCLPYRLNDFTTKKFLRDRDGIIIKLLTRKIAHLVWPGSDINGERR